MNQDNKLLTVKEVAEILKLNALTVYEYIRLGLLPAIKFSRNYRIAEEDLDDFIEKHKVSKLPGP